MFFLSGKSIGLVEKFTFNNVLRVARELHEENRSDDYSSMFYAFGSCNGGDQCR